MVIPTYTADERIEEIVIRALKSYRDQVDELIVTEDGGNYSEKLKSIADIYVYNRKNGGFSFNVNQGWRMAREEFVMIANSDTFLVEGKLKDLCVKDLVTSPKIANQQFHRYQLRGCFFVVPREMQEKLGYLNETMKMYWSDQDYADKTLGQFKEVEEVIVHHLQAESVGYIDQAKFQKADKEAYFAR